jgi:predicted CopG family antitoxin
MSVKTITIDIEAYGLLARRKRHGQSFSQVIKAHFRRQPTVADFLAALKATRLSDQTLRAMERQVKSRKISPARTVRL